MDVDIAVLRRVYELWRQGKLRSYDECEVGDVWDWLLVIAELQMVEGLIEETRHWRSEEGP